MNDDTLIKLGFIFVVVMGVGVCIGSFASTFSIPSCKIWDSPRLYDHILVADDVVCNPLTEHNATYYRYDTVKYNGTEYLVQKVAVGNSTAKGIIVCKGGKV